MKIFGLTVPFTEKRASFSPADDRAFTGFPWVYLGDDLPVTPETAIQFSAVYACVKIISETLSSVPLVMYRRKADGGKDRDAKHPLSKLLRNKPNRFMTGMQFRETLTRHVLLWGNGYCQILRNSAGEPLELIPIHPSRITPELTDAGELVYKLQKKDGGKLTFRAQDIFHLKGYSDSGLEGLSPIAVMKQAIQMGVSLENFGKNFFEGGAFPAGVLQYAGQASMPQEAKENLRESWQKLYGGDNRGRKVAVLEAGVTWHPMGIPQQDAEFLATRKFQIQEIARIYRVPPHMLADLDRATFSNIEQMSQEFVTYCMLPWFKRWEETITWSLLDGDDSELFAEFLVDGLLRGDTASRFAAYQVAIQNGFMNRNEVRLRENLNPYEGGDEFIIPLNMKTEEDAEEEDVEDPIAEEPEDNDDEEETEEDDEGTTDDRQAALQPEARDGEKPRHQEVAEAFRGAMQETWGRVLRKEIRAIKDAARKKGERFDEWFDEFIGEHRSFTIECLKEITRSYCALAGGDTDCVLASVVNEYRESIRDAVSAWAAEPAGGYARSERELSVYWTERVLGYSQGEYGNAA